MRYEVLSFIDVTALVLNPGFSARRFTDLVGFRGRHLRQVTNSMRSLDQESRCRFTLPYSLSTDDQCFKFAGSFKLGYF